MQAAFKDKTFKTRGEVETEIKHFIRSQSATFWSDGIKRLPDRWRKVVASDGEYFV